MSGSARGKGTHPWVQPLVVAKGGGHAETVSLAAKASLGVTLLNLSEAEEKAVEDWLAGPFTKTVRRATLGQLEKLATWAEQEGLSHVILREADSAALAFLPIRYEDMPRQVGRLQVNGTDFSREKDQRLDKDSELRLTVLSSLSTGKAAAQAAHVLWLWGLENGQIAVEEWWRAGAPLAVAVEDFSVESVPSEAISVRDNGLTEVTPNTLTAFLLKK